MRLTQELARRAGIPALRVAGFDFVAYADTEAFLDTCLASGVVILGVEGHYIENGRVYDDIALIADFSTITDCEESVLESRDFIRSVGRPGLVFDFTFDGEHFFV